MDSYTQHQHKLIRSFTYIKPTERHYNIVNMENEYMLIGRRERDRWDIEIKMFHQDSFSDINIFIFGYYKIGE